MSASPNEYMRGVAAIVFAAVVWGTTGTAATFAPEVSAIAIGAAAMGGGGLLQALLAGRGIVRALPQLRRRWALLVLGGLSVALYPLAFYSSMRLAGVTIGTVITIGSAPLLTALIEFVFDRAPLTKRWIFGALVGLTGVVLLASAQGASSHHAAVAGDDIPLGVICGLVGGLTYALYSWTARRLMLRGVPSTVAMGATFGVGGVLLAPALALTGGPFLASWTNAAVGVYMALVPMFLGYVCFGFGLARVSASMAITITLLEPVVAAALAVAIVGERLPPAGWLGAALVVSCLAIVTLPIRPPAARRPKPAAQEAGAEAGG